MISKALRFEILRRDGFACGYCGRKPPEVQLHIDHVVPAALGGPDTPENLRTSCTDCNTGKGSTPPDADSVAQVADDADRWAAAIRTAADEMVAEENSTQWFTDLWLRVVDDGMYLPLDAPQRIARMMKRGLPRPIIEEMVWVTAGAQHIEKRNRYAYFNGCCNRRLDQLHARAAQIVAEDPPDGD